MDKLTVGQMARLNGVSEQTLRLYDRMGLLCAGEKGENGYRYYTLKQSARLDMIQYMKSLGISLKDIKKHLESKDIGLIIDILNRKDAQIDTQMEELRQQKRAIRRTVASFRRFEAAPPDGTIVLEYIDPRPIYCYDTGVNFYEGDIETYEGMLRQLKEHIRGAHLPEIYFWNAGTLLRREDLLARRFVSTEVFVLVDREYVDPALLQHLPAGTYLCIYCDKYDKEREYAERLLDEVSAKGYDICGDYVCEVIYEPPVPNGAERGMYLRLQVPVGFG